ncbi:Hpt domain-containing protein, partial [Bosea sp. (in: a-proteobacteria)]|uniref:Hpt domain-containing protein n=1 Tax=Bosea sp. (in: a-proteobacteria) TaxID=1871050 RepID=UPI0025B82203
MDPLAELKQTFFQECEELLGALEQKLQALDEGSTDSEDVNAAFRAIHSIKGGAGAFGCTELVGFAHVFEAALDHLRSGRVALEDAPFTLFLRCSDAVADLVAAARNDEVAPVRPDLLAALEQVGQAKAAAPAAPAVPVAPPAAAAAPASDAPVGIAALGNLLAMVDAKMGAPAPAAPAAANDGWDDDEPVAAAPVRKPGHDVRIKITPEADLFRRVIEPRVAIGILPAEEIVSVACDLSHVPALETLDVTDCHMRFTVMLRTELSAEEIVAKFDFTLANEEFEVEVLPEAEAAAEPVVEAAPAAAPEVPQNVAADLSAILARLGPATDAAPQPDIQPVAAAPMAAPVAAAP